MSRLARGTWSAPQSIAKLQGRDIVQEHE